MTRTLFGNLQKQLLGWMGTSPVGSKGDEQALAFEKTVTVGFGAGPYIIIADADVPRGFVPYVTDYDISVTTGYLTGTALVLQDSAGVAYSTIARAGLALNAFLTKVAANTTLGTALSQRLGGTASKGLQVVFTGGMTAGAAVVTVRGYYKIANSP